MSTSNYIRVIFTYQYYYNYCDLFISVGSNPRRSAEYEKSFGKASAPMVQMLDEITKLKTLLPFHLHFDNLFASIKLLTHLKENGYQGTGTIRENRIPRDCPLPSKKIMEKKARSTVASIIDRTHGILFVRWVDNGVVTVASTLNGVEPTSGVRRYSQAEKKTIIVPRPNAIGTYNAFMGGVDLMDENIGRYRVGMRGKKWWWCIFTWLLDVCIQNAWQIHKKCGGTMTQLEFRREIVTIYLQRYGSPPKSPGKVPSSTANTDGRVPDDLRYDRIDHFVAQTQDNKRRRCAGQNCKTVGRTMCTKCKVGLCVNCFQSFHTRK